MNVQTLAQGAAGAPVGSIVLWMIVMIVMVVVGGIVLLGVRRRFLDDGEDVGSGVLDLHALRAMRDRNELTEDEFERARERILRSYGADTSALATTSPLDGSLRARPGFDLAGDPLPGSEGDSASGGDPGASG